MALSRISASFGVGLLLPPSGAISDASRQTGSPSARQ